MPHSVYWTRHQSVEPRLVQCPLIGKGSRSKGHNDPETVCLDSRMGPKPGETSEKLPVSGPLQDPNVRFNLDRGE